MVVPTGPGLPASGWTQPWQAPAEAGKGGGGFATGMPGSAPVRPSFTSHSLFLEGHTPDYPRKPPHPLLPNPGCFSIP